MNVIYNSKTKDTIPVVISIPPDKTFDKIQNSLTKISTKLGIERNFLTFMRETYQNPTAYKPPRQTNRQRMPILTISSQHYNTSSSHLIQDKESKDKEITQSHVDIYILC